MGAGVDMEQAIKRGAFRERAEVVQRLKGSMRMSPFWGKMQPWQREALELIADDIGDLITGDHSSASAWSAVEEHATLARGCLIQEEIQ